MAGFDVMQALEREPAGHPVFGDTHGILDRARTLTLMRLEALSRGASWVRGRPARIDRRPPRRPICGRDARV